MSPALSLYQFVRLLCILSVETHCPLLKLDIDLVCANCGQHLTFDAFTVFAREHIHLGLIVDNLKIDFQAMNGTCRCVYIQSISVSFYTAYIHLVPTCVMKESDSQIPCDMTRSSEWWSTTRQILSRIKEHGLIYAAQQLRLAGNNDPAQFPIVFLIFHA